MVKENCGKVNTIKCFYVEQSLFPCVIVLLDVHHLPVDEVLFDIVFLFGDDRVLVVGLEVFGVLVEDLFGGVEDVAFTEFLSVRYF